MTNFQGSLLLVLPVALSLVCVLDRDDDDVSRSAASADQPTFDEMGSI
jgi:hypothetical protein